MQPSDLAETRVVAIAGAVLMQGRLTITCIETDGNEVPVIAGERQLGLHVIDFLTITVPEFEKAGLCDAEAITCIALNIPAPEQRLACAPGRGGRMHERKQSEALIEA